MNKKRTMNSQKTLHEMLESDDEIPSTYKEVPFTPAYQNDNRFNDIAIYNLTKGDSETSEDCSSEISSSQESDDTESVTESKEHPILFKKGVLSRRDAYCIKVFGTQYDDDTLLWFINFTISKDIQSDYNFLVSCLVYDMCEYGIGDNLNKFESKRKQCNTKYSFEYK